jgi:hypothetical protein
VDEMVPEIRRKKDCGMSTRSKYFACSNKWECTSVYCMYSRLLGIPPMWFETAEENFELKRFNLSMVALQLRDHLSARSSNALSLRFPLKKLQRRRKKRRNRSALWRGMIFCQMDLFHGHAVSKQF